MTAVPPLRTGRVITGMAAVLLPWSSPTEVDWPGFETQLRRTLDAGLVPAVNMDTGFVQSIDDAARRRVLDITRGVTAGAGYVAGAFVADREGDAFALDEYRRAVQDVVAVGGTPVLFPSWGLNALDDDGWVTAHAALGAEVDRFLAFELGEMFVPYGRIYSLDAYRALLGIPACVGAKHSSLRRDAEWDRLVLRDAVRPDFMVLTGNDLAIDMVMWGSDYLLGLATFAPDLFARRDLCWAARDPAFHEVNDLLQYLGQFAFRAPVPAYRHDAAMFLKLRGWLRSDEVPEGAARRDPHDREVLADIAARARALAGG